MDIRILKEFVAEVLTVCANDLGSDSDGTCITWGIQEKAMQAGAELGMTKEEVEKIIDEA